jgi:hypothetical protein
MLFIPCDYSYANQRDIEKQKIEDTIEQGSGDFDIKDSAVITGSLKVDTIDEEQSGVGVTVDGTLIKDGSFSGDITGDSATTSDSTVVRTTGDQSIGGVKTFTSTISGDITGDSATTSDSTVVRTTGDQSIGGVKDFTGTVETDTINESSSEAGVTIEGIKFEDGEVAAPLEVAGQIRSFPSSLGTKPDPLGYNAFPSRGVLQIYSQNSYSLVSHIYGAVAGNPSYATYLGISRGDGTVGSETALVDGSDIGGIAWRGSIGADTFTTAAYIRGEVTGTWSAGVGNQPLDLIFSNNGTNAMTIDSSGDVSMTGDLDVTGNTTINGATTQINGNLDLNGKAYIDALRSTGGVGLANGVNVSGVSLLNCSSAIGNINGFSGGQTGDIIFIYGTSGSCSATFLHSNAGGFQPLFLNTSANVTLSGYGGLIFINGGGNWFNISSAL